MTKEKKNNLTVIAAVVALGGVCYFGYKTRRLENAVNKAAEKMANEIDVPDCIVAAAIKKAADKIAQNAVDDAANYATGAIRNDLKNEIKGRVAEAIKGELSNIEIDVRDQITKKISAIDIDDAKDEIVEKIVDRCENKFKDTMNDFVDAYKEKLAWVMRLANTTGNPFNSASKIELHF